MAIEYDAVGSGTCSVCDPTWTHTVTGSGSGRILVVNTSVRSGDPGSFQNAFAGVTVGGQGMTYVEDLIYGDLRTYLWILTNPPTGASSVVADLNPGYSGANALGVSVSYTGVDGEEPLGTVYEKNEWTPAAISQAVASAEGELALAICGSIYTTLHTPSAGSTERIETGIGTGGAHCRGSINDEPGAASVDVGFSAATTNEKILISTTLRPEVVGRQRAVKYFHNVWDPNQAVLDNTGRDVPIEQIKGDDWLRTLGVLLPTSKVYTNLIGNPEVGYIEAIKKSERDKTARIKAGRESLLATFLSRLAGRGV